MFIGEDELAALRVAAGAASLYFVQFTSIRPPEFLTISEDAPLPLIGKQIVCDRARHRRIPLAKVEGQCRIQRAGLDGWLHRGSEAASSKYDLK